MDTLVTGLGTFTLALLVHLTMWRFYVPKSHTRVLLTIFSGLFLTIALFILIYRDSLGFLDEFLPATPAAWIYTIFFYGCMVGGYITHYLAIEWDSPSMLMVLRVTSAGTNGLPRSELEQMFLDGHAAITRVENLVLEGMLEKKNGIYYITKRGKRLLKLFGMFRCVAGFEGKVI